MAESRDLLRRYYLFRATNSSGFYLPVAVVILRDKGFGLDFVGLAYAVFAFGMLVSEVPSGYVGDWLGRRRSLVAGAVLRTVVVLAYPFVQSGSVYLVLHVVWAAGWAFRSGTQDAWLYEILQARYDESAYATIESRGNVAELVISAVTAILGGLLYSVNPAYPFLANAGLATLGIPLLYTFPTIERLKNGESTGSGAESDDDPAESDDVLTVREAVGILRLQVRRPEVRWVVAYAALFNSLFVVTRIYEQPALTAVGVPVAGFGVLYAGFKLVSAGAASTVGWLHDRIGTRGVFLSLVPLYGLAYASVALAPMLVIPVLFLNRGLHTIVRPVRNQYLNDRLADVGRATVLSGASMALSLVGGVARIVAGRAAELLGPVGFLPWAGVALSLAAGGLWVLVSPVRQTGTPEGAGAADTTGAAQVD
ncbi:MULTISPECIES: MFS transporter [Halorussus]|uniref:MFS transporter n=1 Tax=Halorussus TaxID=1070314 RepID=UPI000E20F57B|nr:MULTISPECIES: MFS transporter [Halorussus]NHN58872.1 MFS transporter [Halorussus sp. JP-T4]